MNPDLLLRFARRFPIANLGPLWLVSSEAEIRQVLTSSDYGKGGLTPRGERITLER